MSLSLFVVAGATEDGGTAAEPVILNTKPKSQQNTDGTVEFEVWLDPQGTKTIGAFQFTVEGVGCTLTKAVTYKNAALEYDEEKKTGIFAKFGGDFSGNQYSFVAAGTVSPNNPKGEQERTWTATEPTHIVTLTVKPTADYCYLKVITDTDKRFTVGAKDDNGTVSAIYTTDVKQDGFGTPAITTCSITGKVTSYNAANEATVKLMKGDAVVKSAAVSGTTGVFTITGVPAGTYDLVVTKAAHLTYTIKNVKVESSDIDLTTMTDKPYQTITLLCGDLNGDGMINPSDINVIYEPANYYKNATDDNRIADLNGDGMINPSDINIIYEAANYYKTTANCTFDF